MLTCGERIKELRRQKRISQTELAEIVGVKKNTVSTWERDTRKPDQRALKKLTEYFGVSWEYILGEGSESQQSTPIQYGVVGASSDDGIQEKLMRLLMLDSVSKAIILAAIDEAYRLDKKNKTLQPLKYDFTFTEV